MTGNELSKGADHYCHSIKYTLYEVYLAFNWPSVNAIAFYCLSSEKKNRGESLCVDFYAEISSP